jgi:hypothetical protein
MTNARVASVPADRVGAREFLDQAEIFMADASAAGLHAISQTVLLHNATISTGHMSCGSKLRSTGWTGTPRS